MKKFFAVFAVAALVCACSFAAELSKPVNLKFAAQEVGTGNYSFSNAIQGAMMKGMPQGSNISLTTTSPGGVGAPIIVNGGAKCDIALANAAPARWSYESGILGKGATKEIAALAGGLGHDFVNVMLTKKFVDATGISTIEEIVAKKYPVKLIIKKNGSFGELSAEKVLEALGVTLEDITKWGGQVEKTGGDAIKSGLQDDLYDMTIDHISAGQANTTELCLTHEMVCVQMADSTLAKLVDMGYSPINIEANTWAGQKETVKSVGSQQVILVSSKMSEDVAYALTKAVCDNYKDLGEQVAAMKDFNPVVAGTKNFAGVPLHPGAARYYKEKGYSID